VYSVVAKYQANQSDDISELISGTRGRHKTELIVVRAAVIQIDFRLLEKFGRRLAIRTAKFDPNPTSAFMQREKNTTTEFRRREKTRGHLG
jgi:hypothetical protein